jgi:ABC-type hemin transport system substrate-binding protein
MGAFAAREVPEFCYTVRMFPPQRIVCLTEETVETLYLLGEEHRIVGVSGYWTKTVKSAISRMSSSTKIGG